MFVNAQRRYICFGLFGSGHSNDGYKNISATIDFTSSLIKNFFSRSNHYRDQRIVFSHFQIHVFNMPLAVNNQVICLLLEGEFKE